jgi:two-component system OmpR family response regulator
VNTRTHAARRLEPSKALRQSLVVEDDVNSREGLRGLLAVGGYRVDTAADGWEALERIKQETYELAIVDLDLPIVHGIAMDGWDVARIVRAFCPEVAIVVVSGRGDDEVRAAAQMDVAFLEKPISMSDLRSVIAELFPAA